MRTRASHPTVRASCALAWAVALIACGADDAPPELADAPPEPTAAPPEPLASGALDDAFQVVDSLGLEENAQVLTVQPMVTVGDPGELLVTEPMEGEVRVYGVDGGLRANFGRRGDGPGEFTFPITAHRTRAGELVVADPGAGRLTFLSSHGPDSVQLAYVPGIDMIAAHDLGGGRYLLAGHRMGPGRAPGEFLHRWNRETGEVERSFLPMMVPEEMRTLAFAMTGVVAVVEADTIWAAWSIPDTLYKFSIEGDRLAALPLALPRPGSTTPRGGETTRDPVSMQEEFDAITQIMNIFLLGDGQIAIQSMQTRGNDAVWDLLLVDREGNDLWKRAGMPRLYVVADDLFYFQDPSSIQPNKWIVARWTGIRSDNAQHTNQGGTNDDNDPRNDQAPRNDRAASRTSGPCPDGRSIGAGRGAARRRRVWGLPAPRQERAAGDPAVLDVRPVLWRVSGRMVLLPGIGTAASAPG